MDKLFLKKNTNRIIVIMIAILLLIAIVSPIVYNIYSNKNGVMQAEAQDLPPENSTQAINDADNCGGKRGWNLEFLHIK